MALSTFFPSYLIMKQTFIFAFALFFFSSTAFVQEPEQWSRFRGPNGQGISTATGLPTQWSATENIAWKTPIPGGNSWSSPVIWNDRIFLTTTTDGGKECRVLAIDRKSGSILWNKLVFTQEIRQKHPRNSEATPTPVTDGERVYAVFANGSFVALDFEGTVVWTNTDLNFYSHHGFGTSPMIYGDLLITAINPSVNPNNNPNNEQVRIGWQLPWDRSYLLALDKKTGKERWRGARGMSRISHSTPVVIQVDGKDQIVSMTGDVIQGFEPATGELIWTVKSSGEPAVPVPAIGEGMVFAATAPSSPIIGIKTDGKGDCTETHVVWEQSRNVPMTSSFLYIKPCLYAAADNGTFIALDAATGEVLWQHRLEGRPDSSPIYADGKIYVTTHIGVTTVFKLNDDPKKPAEVIAVNETGETVQATLAIAGKQLFLRTETELWCIGK
jgi:outer membrane protein assembly factor BamB